MKRSEIRRTVPMPRPTKPMARGPIRKVSAQKRKRDREQKPLLDDYRARFPLCQRCGRRAGEEIHEILGGPLRWRARALRSCILHLCGGIGGCHRVVQYWSKAKQLALKAWADPSAFDLLQVNELRGHSPISMAAVDEYLTPLREDGVDGCESE